MNDYDILRSAEALGIIDLDDIQVQIDMYEKRNTSRCTRIAFGKAKMVTGTPQFLLRKSMEERWCANLTKKIWRR